MNLFYIGKNGAALRFVKEMEATGTADRIREEQGNLRYEYYSSVSDPETVLLVDAWEDQEALNRHHQSPMMEMIASLREKYDLHMKAERYTEQPDDSDERFIRR